MPTLMEVLTEHLTPQQTKHQRLLMTQQMLLNGLNRLERILKMNLDREKAMKKEKMHQQKMMQLKKLQLRKLHQKKPQKRRPQLPLNEIIDP